jgi:TRAP-type mannitol/chloroaromatic compound transport system substrate-binding protein
MSCAGSNNQESQEVDYTKEYHWKMVTTWPPGFPAFGESCEMFSSLVDTMSGGRLKIKVYGAGELVPAMETFGAVSSGVVEMGSGCAYYWSGKTTSAQFFATVPFGMNAQQMQSWLVSGGGYELWREVYEPFDIVPFMAGNSGVQMGGWFNKEINSIEDFKGLKMRMPGLGARVLERAGAAAVTVAGGEIYTNLERGVIDATEWVGPYHDYKMGFHKIAKYYYTPGWHEPGTNLEFIVNKAAFESLPPDLRQIIESASYQVNTWVLAEFESKNSQFLEKLYQEGVEVRSFPDEVMSALRVMSDEVIQEMIEGDPLAEKVFDSYSSYRSQASGWSEHTEKAFFEKIQK